MSCSELELAKRHLSLAQKVYDAKRTEFDQVKVLIERLQEQLLEAEQDTRNAKKALQKVERRLCVVVIEDHDEDEGQNTLVCTPTTPRGYKIDQEPHPSSRPPKSPTCHPTNDSDGMSLSLLLRILCWAMKGLPMPSSLRRSLKRYHRKMSSLPAPKDQYRE
jgi:hypothetical protein